MQKNPIMLALTFVIFIQAVPAFCGVSRTTTFHLSVTIPEHIMFNNAIQNNPYSKNPYQLMQTQTVIRNNKSIRLTSIVVP